MRAKVQLFLPLLLGPLLAPYRPQRVLFHNLFSYVQLFSPKIDALLHLCPMDCTLTAADSMQKPIVAGMTAGAING
ncbi:hypothetical protein [Paenibacillus sp. LjRoot56]|uniref:hypothetical protein n=1 Tax=Paenibacillus sp. LjRoot56 TaxID=3342333 RepID=UPI003ED14249